MRDFTPCTFSVSYILISFTMSGEDVEKINDVGKTEVAFVQCPPAHGGTFVCEMHPKEILMEFKKLYEDRIKRIDGESGDNQEMKVTALEEWVDELMKQNAMLVDVVSELERETCERVTFLESRLKCSAQVAQESILQLQNFEAKMWDPSAERIKAQTYSLKTKSNLILLEQELMKLKLEVEGLRSDASSLLKFIKRGVKTGNWSFTDLALNEISLDELQSAFEGIVRETQEISGIEEPGNKCRTLGQSKSNSALEQEIIEKDSIIARLEAEVTHMSQELSLCESAYAIGKLGAYLTDSNENTRCHITMQLEKSKEENEKKCLIISTLREENADMKKIIVDLKRHISDLEKASRETRDVLISEVAEKHDQMLLLRGEVEKLEEALHKACMQMRFKDDIIKEMRHEIRSSRAKVASLESEIQNRNLEHSNLGVTRANLSQNCTPGGQQYSSFPSRKHLT